MLQNFLTVDHVVCFYRRLTFWRIWAKSIEKFFVFILRPFSMTEIISRWNFKRKQKTKTGLWLFPSTFPSLGERAFISALLSHVYPKTWMRVSVEGATCKAQKEGNVWVWSTRSPLCQISMVETIKMPSCSPSHPSLFLYLLTPHPRLP